MVGITEIKKVQGQGSWAEHETMKAVNLILEVIEFLCCNKFMRIFRFLFRKKFDEQYDKLSKAIDWLHSAEESLEDQWDLLEDYWDEEMNADYEKWD